MGKVSGGLIEPSATVRSSLSRAQLARLFRLVVILQSDRFPNARELAEQCEVSRRTIYRDLELLSDAGVPVRYRQERQGYQLVKGFFLPPTNLSEHEALALLVLSRQWEGGDVLGLLKEAQAGAVKIVQCLPEGLREKVLAAGAAFRSPRASAENPADRAPVYATVLAALSAHRQLRLAYRDPKSLVEESTKFCVFRIMLHDRRWFLVGRSSLHRRIEMIGLPWIVRADLTGDIYVVPPRFSLERFLAQSWGVSRGSECHVWCRFGRRVAHVVLDAVWHPSQKRILLDDGRVDLHFMVDRLDEVVRWVLGFGDEVEIIAPLELRERIHEIGRRIAQTHSSGVVSRNENGPVH